jgi:hypothetical protein
MVVGMQDIFMFPCDFIFGVIILLNLVKSGSLVLSDSVLLVRNLDGICLVCQIWLEWNGVFNYHIGWRLQTTFELGDMKHIMNS